MVCKYGLSNVHTQNFIKKIHKTFMETDVFGLLKWKWLFI
jgi:hypothetical protein